MKTLLTVEIEIRPIAKQSTRFGGGRAYTSRRHLVYAGVIATHVAKALEEQPWKTEPEWPLAVQIEAHFAWPKSKKKEIKEGTVSPRVSTPDVDNITKPLLDAMKALWADDRQVADLRVRKFNSQSNKIILRVQRWLYPQEPFT